MKNGLAKTPGIENVRFLFKKRGLEADLVPDLVPSLCKVLIINVECSPTGNRTQIYGLGNRYSIR